MPRSLNRCTFIGRPLKDPTPGQLPDGAATTSFILAVGNTTGQPTLVRIAGAGKVADVCNKLLRAGREVYIEGRFQNRAAPDTPLGVITEIAMENMQLIGERSTTQSDQ